MSAPFVGPPTDGAGCAYGLDLDSPACSKTPTVHVAVDSAWGVVGLESCDEHASVARGSGKVLAEHAWSPSCDEALCWEVRRGD